MNSIGTIIASGERAEDTLKKLAWAEAVRSSETEFSRQRPWKVRISVLVCSEVEVIGNVNSVDRAAEKLAADAAVTMHTTPGAFRKFVQKRRDPRDPASPLEWVEVVWQQVDAADHGAPFAWQLKRK